MTERLVALREKNEKLKKELIDPRGKQALAIIALYSKDPRIPYTDIVQSLTWQDDSLCAQTDMEAFFPENHESTEDAKRICNACEVQQQCLAYAVLNNLRKGFLGGLSERERRQLRANK